MQASTIDRRVKVVIVDDSMEIQERLAAMLRDIPGVEVAGQAASVAEAISAVHRLKPDVMILDLRLPDGNGMEVLRLVQREQTRTRIIVLTSYAYPQYEQRAREAGVHAFLNKAHEFGRVAELVRSLISDGGQRPVEPARRTAEPQAEGPGRRRVETLPVTGGPGQAPGRASSSPWGLAHLAAIVDSSDDAIIGKRLDGTIKSWNNGAERLFGYPASEMIGQNITRIVPPELHAQEAEILRRVARGERVEHYETVRLARSGRRIAVSLMISPVHDKVGRVVGAAKIARDITERKRAEEALRLERAALEVAANAIVITNREGTIEWANQAFSTLTGYALSEAVGRNPRDLIKSDKHDREFYRTLWETILAGRVWRGEITNRRKDGREFIENMTITPVPDASGAITHFIAIKQDITAHKQSEEALQASEERFRRFMQQFPGLAYIKDAEGRVLFANEAFAAQLGMAVQSLPGRTNQELFPADFAAKITGDDRQVLALGKDQEFEEIFGGRIWTSRKFPIVQAGAAPLLGGITLDITARKRAEEALRESETRFRSLSNASLEGIMIHDQGLILDANLAFARLFGYEQPEEIIGKNGPELLLSPESAARIRKRMQRRESGPLEVTGIRKDGSTFTAETESQALKYQDRDARIVSCRDISERKRAEEALRLAHERLRHFVDSNIVGIIVGDKNGAVLEANDYYLRLIGYTREELNQGRVNWRAITPPEWLPMVEKAFEELRERGTCTPYEKEYVRRDGSRVPVLLADTLLPGPEEQVAAFVFDLTERKQIEDSVRKSESLLRATLESTADGILVVSTDGRVLDSNRQFRTMWRLPESVVSIHEDQKLLDCVLEQLESPEEFLAGVRALYTQPDKEGFDTLQFKDGRVFERFSNPQRLGDRIVGRVWSFRDVTARIQAEAHNREQAALLDNANDAIYVTALDCTILYWNRGAERTYGWTSAEALNRKTTELISPDAAAAQTLAAVLLKQESWSGERRQVTKGGGLVEVFSRLTLVRDAQGRPQSVFAINTDITEKKQLESQFLRAQRLESIGALASGIAHDLNNVLAPIIMAAPLLQTMVNDPTARQLLKTMETSAQRGAGIVRQVLTFARGVEGERVRLEPVHLLRELERFAGETFPKGIRVESALAADLRPVLGDATQLHQALMNLCINARDAMPRGGVLTLEAANVELSRAAAEKISGAQPGSYACLRVTDTGVGIPPEVEAKIFEPFFTTKGVGKGTGLGLSTVLGIVRSHGGFVRVVTHVGRGSTFELYLPATTTGEVAAKKDSAPPWPRSQGEGILVVDDEAAVREVTRQALLGFGYRIITTGRGAEAIRIFQEHRAEIQLVLTDMMMPEMDGPTLVAALRALDPTVKIVGISGASDPMGEAGLNALALSAMLAKPFTIEMLLAVIRDALPVGGPVAKL